MTGTDSIQDRPVKTVGICAPSARFDKTAFEQGIRVLKELGYDVRYTPDIFSKKRYLAGDDQLRAETFQALITDTQIDAVICARGGFGSMRMLEYLDWTLIGRNQKPVIGFSDSTALLLSILDKAHIPVIHGPTLTSLADASRETRLSLQAVLKGEMPKFHINDGLVIHKGFSTGILKGGNLATLVHLIGTPYQPDLGGCILFIEDTGEPAYKIDRMLTQMKLCGLFNNLKGVVVGSFENCDFDDYIEPILKDIFDTFNMPVLTGLETGHGKINLSLIMGLPVELDATKKTLTWKKTGQ